MGTMVEVRRDLKKYFKTPKGLLHAVDGINFEIEKGKTLGISRRIRMWKIYTGKSHIAAP